MSERMIRYSLSAFLILLPIQTVWLWREAFIDGAKWQYGTIGLYGTDVLLSAAILFFVTSYLMRNPEEIQQVKKFIGLRVKLGMTNAVLAAFILWSGLSVLWAEDRVLAWYFFLKLILAFGAFHLARTMKFSRGMMFLTFGSVVGVAFSESALGAWQFLSQSSFASTWFGMSGYKPWQAGVSVLKNESGRWLRAYGTFPHPNMFGAYLGVILLIAVGYLVLTSPSKKRFSLGWCEYARPSGKTFFKGNVAISCWLAVMSLAFVLSFSRSAWLGALIGLSSLTYAVYMQNDTEIKRRFIRTVGVIILATAVFVGILHEVVFPRFDGATIKKEASIIDRAVLMHQAEEIIREYPLLGVGTGNYTLAVMRKHPEISVWDVQPAHNVFLLVFAELGIVGGSLFILFVISILAHGFRSLFSEDKKENTIFFIALLSLIPSLFLDHFLRDSHFGLLFFFLLAGFSLRD